MTNIEKAVVKLNVDMDQGVASWADELEPYLKTHEEVGMWLATITQNICKHGQSPVACLAMIGLARLAESVVERIND